MRPMMRLILGLCALVVILAGIALELPSEVTIARSTVINAPESVVFAYLNSLKRFNDWSPWAARDPQLQSTLSGAEQGQGAKIEWSGTQKSVGTGSVEITESNPNRHIGLAVDFNGLDGTSYYDISPSGSGSKVVWGFNYSSGTSPLKRWKGLMLDRYVGAEFSDGLGKLKELIESERRPTAPPPVAEPMVQQPDGAAPESAGSDAPPEMQPEAAPAPEEAAPQPAAEPAPAPPPVKKKKKQ
jgi:Polyketide cyclase / dehydrase and lipid transport